MSMFEPKKIEDRPARPSIVDAMKAVDQKQTEALAVAAVAQALASLSPVEKRNIRHARVMNSLLQTMYDEGRDHMDPTDIQQLYIMTAAIDAVAGCEATPLDPSFRERKPTPKRDANTERTQHQVDVDKTDEG